MNHEDHCQICREGIERLLPGQRVYGGKDKTTGIYIHTINLTDNLEYAIVLSKRSVKKLILTRKEVNKMKTDLEAQLEGLQKLAALGQAVIDLVREGGALAPRKKRHRRTKAEMKAAVVEAAPVVEEKPKPKPKRKAKARKAAPTNSAAVEVAA